MNSIVKMLPDAYDIKAAYITDTCLGTNINNVVVVSLLLVVFVIRQDCRFYNIEIELQ